MFVFNPSHVLSLSAGDNCTLDTGNIAHAIRLPYRPGGLRYGLYLAPCSLHSATCALRPAPCDMRPAPCQNSVAPVKWKAEIFSAGARTTVKSGRSQWTLRPTISTFASAST